MKEIEWKSVPGYSNYQLNIATLSVRNLSTNKNLVLRKGMVQLIGENGNICINMPRLLFCVSKGIPPPAGSQKHNNRNRKRLPCSL